MYRATVWVAWPPVGLYWAPQRSISPRATPGPRAQTFLFPCRTIRFSQSHRNHHLKPDVGCRLSVTRTLSTLLVVQSQLEARLETRCFTSHLRPPCGPRAWLSLLRPTGSSSRLLPSRRINYFANKLGMKNCIIISFISSPRHSNIVNMKMKYN